MVPRSVRRCDGVIGVSRGVVDRITSHSECVFGIDVFPNLGYKKDAFLEPSLVSNNFPLLTQQTNNHSYSQLYRFILDSAMSSNSMQQQQSQQPIGTPGLDPRSPRFAPRGPTGPLPVDTLGCLARAIQEGGEMRGNMFVTMRGDQISCPHGRRPPHGRIGGPYPRIDEVSERI